MAQDWASFTTNIAVKSTLNTIYNAWTKASEIEKMFLETCTIKDTKNNILDNNENVTSDYSYEWTFFLYEILEKGKITKTNGKDFIQFTFAGDCFSPIP
ncbi:MAG: hypothetical protein ACK5NT_09430 [Pyrinomonadaceae bacterium]